MKKDFLADLVKKGGQPNELVAPLVAMTATATETMWRVQFPQVTGLQVNDDCVFWPQPQEMQRRHFDIHFDACEKHLAKIKKYLKQAAINLSRLYWFCDCPKTAEANAKKVEDLFDEKQEFVELPSVDCVVLHGQLDSLLKFHAARLLTGPVEIHDEEKGLCFRPLLGFMTKCAGTGMDDENVRFVYRQGFPDTMTDLYQESGQVGRCPGASPKRDQFRLAFHLQDYCSKQIRLANIGQNSEERGMLLRDVSRQQQAEEFHEVFREVVLPDGCLHLLLEWHFGHLQLRGSWHDFKEAEDPCKTACSYCRDKKKGAKRVRPCGVREIIKVRYAKDNAANKPLRDKLPKLIAKYPGSEGKCFQHGRSSRCMEQAEAKILLMQLLAARILLPKVVQGADKSSTVYATLNVLSNGDYAIDTESYWDRIPHTKEF